MNQVFWVEVTREKADMAEALLSMLPHGALDRERFGDLERIGLYLTDEVDKEHLDGIATYVEAKRHWLEELADKDWVAHSQSGLPPVHAGRIVLVGSHDLGLTFHPGCHRLLIDAATAFGTGHHGSTKGCLLMLDRLAKRVDPRPKTVLDVGSGTGVLAIAAAKLFRCHGIATDIDAQSVRVCEENTALNHEEHRIKCAVADGYTGVVGRYDLIFANILARPLVTLAPGARKHITPGGHIILAGLQVWQEAMVLAAYRAQGFVMVDRLRLDKWTTLMLRRPK